MHRQQSQTEQGFAIIEALLVVLIVAAVGFVGWYVWHARENANTSLTNATNISQSTSAKTATTSTPASKTDNGSLNTDLTSIGGSLNQAMQAQTAASNGLNDQQNQINIPAN